MRTYWPILAGFVASCGPSDGTPAGILKAADTGTPAPSTSGTTTSNTTTTTTTTASTQIGFPWVPYDCSAGVPPGPFSGRVMPGTYSNEDIAMDLEGFLVTPDFSGNVLRVSYLGNQNALFSGFSDPTGLEVLPNGDILIADRNQGALARWDHITGAVWTVTTGLLWPNGVEIAPDGSAFIADTTAEAVYWVDSDTGDRVTVASDIAGADGITFNETYEWLYVGSIMNGDIVKVHVDGPGVAGTIEPFVSGQSAPWDTADGLQVDRCGNLYVADFWDSVWRVDPVTRDVELVVSYDSFIGIPSMRFGSALGDWDPLKLYVSTYGEVLEVDVGVPNKERWPPVWP